MWDLPDHPDIGKIEMFGYAVEEETQYQCDICGESLFEGEAYFEINGEIFCEFCLERIYKKFV